MNQRKGGAPNSHAANQPRAPQTRDTPPNRQGLVQPKLASPTRTPPAAPPAYRPLPVPRVLQAKAATGQPPRPGQPNRTPAAPAADRPQAKSAVRPKAAAPPAAGPKNAAPARGWAPPPAPPAYRPQPVPAVPQRKTAHAPRPYRPQAAPKVPQARAALPANNARPAAPRPQARPPQPAPKVSQPKAALAKAGVRAHTARGGTIQPMITIAGPNPKDYATLKVLRQLVAFHGGADNPNAQIHTLSVDTDFSKMKAGEKLYIVGHGFSNSGNIKGVETPALISWLNHKKKGIPPHIGGIVILTCYGGLPLDETGKSLATKIAEGLKHGGISVQGATGFAYGSTQTERTGLNSVLPKDFQTFYNEDNKEAMIEILKELTPNDNLNLNMLLPSSNIHNRVYVNSYQPLKNQLSNKQLGMLAERFIKLRNGIEGAMKRIVEHMNAPDVTSAVKSLAKNKRFGRLVKQQYNLFNLVFRSQDEAYQTVTS